MTSKLVESVSRLDETVAVKGPDGRDHSNTYAYVSNDTVSARFNVGEIQMPIADLFSVLDMFPRGSKEREVAIEDLQEYLGSTSNVEDLEQDLAALLKTFLGAVEARVALEAERRKDIIQSVVTKHGGGKLR